ncbi:MAG: hypothetical protein ACOYU5_08760 [Stygiobacter sp.]
MKKSAEKKIVVKQFKENDLVTENPNCVENIDIVLQYFGNTGVNF